MPANKMALLRYKTIDQCLQNRQRKWTLEDLIDEVSEALYEYEGIDNGVSKRTIQLDIQNMRSDKLGYNAPIVVKERKFYTYEDNEFSITKKALADHELATLNDVMSILRQFKGFSYFNDLSEMLTRLEDKVIRQTNEGRSYIDFFKNEEYKGLDFIEPLHLATRERQQLVISYQSFKAKKPQDIFLSPYLLKEYNNRWFILGSTKTDSNIITLALDRIKAISNAEPNNFIRPTFKVEEFYNDVIGVSKTLAHRPRTIVMRILKKEVQYIITKPLHTSQEILKDEGEWIIFSIHVIWNFELEREIIGRGESIEVLSPKRLRNKVIKRLENTLAIYQQEEDD